MRSFHNCRTSLSTHQSSYRPPVISCIGDDNIGDSTHCHRRRLSSKSTPPPILLLLIASLFAQSPNNSIPKVECFTLPPQTPTAVVASAAYHHIHKTSSNYSHFRSRCKWQKHRMSNDDEYDEVSSSTSIREDDRVENYNNIKDDDDNNDDDDDDDEQPIKKPRQLSLAELEDYEEARQAALELEELESPTTTSSSTSRTSSLTSSSASMVSNADSASSMTSTAANAALSVSSSNTIYAPSSSSITTFNADDGNNNNNSNLPQTTAATYVPNTPQQEIDLAQKRDVLQNTRLNEMFAEEDAMTANRQAQIRALLDEDDKVWKEERRKRMLGKYATVESWEEVERLMEEDRRKEAQEIELKVNLAKRAGVTLTMLEPTDGGGDVVYNNNNMNVTATNTASTFNPTIGVSGRNSWFGPEDAVDLEMEFQLLKNKQSDVVNGEGGEGKDSNTASMNEDNVPPRFVNGKLTSLEQLMGISVGSAGGWSLEVYPGDFVVHRKYGIGQYEKTVLKPKTKLTMEEREAVDSRRKEIINQLMQEGKGVEDIQKVVETFGTEYDTDPISNPLSTLLEIKYSDVVVHVPIERAYRLSRYRAGDAAIKPRLSRVKGEAWSKAKQKVEVSTVQMAEDVLALYATRETLNRSPFDPSLEGKVKEFAKTFAFDPTPDQKKCFEDVENDMVWRSRPMDRLICGDVGFGKTEVAMRALFRAVVNGRQAALLAPTGVLAAQHYKNIVKRVGEGTEYGFRVALLRGGMGKNTKKGRELRAAIAAGDVDLVIGTHALLSNGMSFKHLGLLTIDEEQRFGVNQKERLKLICNCVDVLTLSATPIPRTLQMSLSGIRDTSTIRSPPPMRKPTVSYVQEFEEGLVRDAIERELARGGQCYYVVPRISQLEGAETMLKKIFPSLRVIQAHGRMARGAAEENVAAFAEGNYDVLLATTVIENGVDIPRVNTMIIQNAQAFGMSTLYQLRGRVGRSDLQAYAYFFHKNDFITEQSAQRLRAMADLHELGSGFDVANRDLEIRGAGSLLGTEQSGMAARVGFDLYMRMLKKSMRQLRGLDLPVVPRSNVLLPGREGCIEWVADGLGVNGDSSSSASYIIPDSYIKDANERSSEESLARLAESTQRLVEITNTWREKYGPIPAELQNNLKALHLHTCLRQLGIDVVGLDNTSGDCILRSPGLRPRHWAMICSQLPKGAPPKGLDVIFPARFCFSDVDTEIPGGKRIDLNELLTNPGYSDDEEEWDALDEEEVEAMKEISSAVNIQSLDEIEVQNYPRFVMKELSETAKVGSRVDALLKVLLPPSKIVFQKQQGDKEKAKVAAELREKRELIAKQKKEQEKISRRVGYQF